VRFDILTLHPSMCREPLTVSILGRAQKEGKLTVRVHDLRDHGLGRHQQVDDAPYGGGSGMVLRVDVIDQALSALKEEGTIVLLMDPAGRPFLQEDALRLAAEKHLLFICGHYEGVDGRVEKHLVDESYSIGDYVLTGGELPAMVMIDAIARQLPGVLGNPESLEEESFSAGRLEAPVYTRPRSYNGWDVPSVLLSGHHANVDSWRAEQSMERTKSNRPDLFEQLDNSVAKD
jgi:tRNA (guanine37-N1)-methyltransferase